MGQYGTLIQPIGYLLISPPFSIVKMIDKNINDLLSFSVFFLINEFLDWKSIENSRHGIAVSLKVPSENFPLLSSDYIWTLLEVNF